MKTCMYVIERIGELEKTCPNRAIIKIVGYDYNLEVRYDTPDKTHVSQIISHPNMIEGGVYYVCRAHLTAIENDAWLRHARICMELPDPEED